MRGAQSVAPTAASQGGGIAEVVADVGRDGWSHVGVLDEALTRRLRSAVDKVAARSSGTTPGGQLHQMSGLSHHPDLVEVVDWPPLLAVVLELLSPNVYINHSHLDVHPPHPPTGARRWHRDNGMMGRDMGLSWRDQPRVTVKVAVYLTDVELPDDGALEVVPRSHNDTKPRHPTEHQPHGVAILGPAGTVAVVDARVWHRRRDNLGTRTRRAIFMAYSYRWLTSRDVAFEDVPAWVGVSPGRRQLLGGGAVDPYYWAPGELPLDRRPDARQRSCD
ncbi:MAG: phytanoyl-CoA dioxygenase family protein [Acidimicrobiales bacterium]